MILVEITDKGRKVANDFRPIIYLHQKQWLAVLDETEQQQLIDALHHLQESLQDSNRSMMRIRFTLVSLSTISITCGIKKARKAIKRDQAH